MDASSGDADPKVPMVCDATHMIGHMSIDCTRARARGPSYGDV
jgi:hypothetical protein